MAREQLLWTCVLLSIALCAVHPTLARKLLQEAEQQCSQACFDAALPNFDVGSSFLYLDAGCRNESLPGCQASTGCRLCQISSNALNPQCPQCVCEYYASQGTNVPGCVALSPAAAPPIDATSPSAQSSTPPLATPPPQPADTLTPPALTPPSPLAAPPNTPTAPQGNTTITVDLQLVGPQSVLIPFDLERQQQVLLALTQAVPALGSSIVSFTSITITGRRLRRTLLQDPSVTVLATLSVTTAANQATQLSTDIQNVLSSGAVTANLASQGFANVSVSSVSPPPDQTPVPPTGGSSGSTSVGAIVGGAVGGVAVLLLLAALALYFLQRRRRGQTSSHPSILKPTHKSPLSSTAASAAGIHQPRVADSVQMIPSTPSPKLQGLIVTENKSRLSLDSSLPYVSATWESKQQGEMKWLQAPSPPVPVSAPNSRPPSFDVRRGMDDPKREPTSGKTFAMSAADRAWRSVELSKEMVQQVADTYGPEEEAAPSSPARR